MTVKQAIRALRAAGHKVHPSLAQPGNKWIVHYKGSIGAPSAMYQDDLIAAAQKVSRVTP